MTAPRILVVEDERIIALHLRQQLTKFGYDVPNAVSTGDHALRRIEESRPDLVLMDINLKGRLDGIATPAAIPPEYRIPVIYLTAYSEDETVARAAATNPHGFLVKPFSGRELHAMIQVTLSRCRAEHAARVAAERHQQARKMEALGRLASGLAHEVDDLLMVLYGQLEILGNHAIDKPALAEPIRDTFCEAIDKERLIQQLLDFSGGRQLTPATVSIGDLLAGVTNRLRQIVAGSIKVELLLPDGIWRARIDPEQLSRALANLAANAREAMPDGGSLIIEGQNTIIDEHDADGPTGPGRYVLLSVADTGTGMHEHVTERAFEPFFTTREADCGRGLGLSLVFGFIRQSGGHISIDSKPGGGTTVRLWLPAATEDTIALADPDARDTFNWADKISMASGVRPRQPERPARLVTHDTDGVSPVLWHKSEKALFAAVPAALGQVRYRLIVEPLPRMNGFDWAVWRPGEGGETSRHGRASSVVSAMAAAEDAARHWNNAEFPGT